MGLDTRPFTTTFDYEHTASVHAAAIGTLCFSSCIGCSSNKWMKIIIDNIVTFVL